MSPQDRSDSHSGHMFIQTTPGNVLGEGIRYIINSSDLSKSKVSSIYSFLEATAPEHRDVKLYPLPSLILFSPEKNWRISATRSLVFRVSYGLKNSLECRFRILNACGERRLQTSRLEALSGSRLSRTLRNILTTCSTMSLRVFVHSRIFQ